MIWLPQVILGIFRGLGLSSLHTAATTLLCADTDECSGNLWVQEERDTFCVTVQKKIVDRFSSPAQKNAALFILCTNYASVTYWAVHHPECAAASVLAASVEATDALYCRTSWLPLPFFLDGVGTVAKHVVPSGPLNNCWLAPHRGPVQLNSDIFLCVYYSEVPQRNKGLSEADSHGPGLDSVRVTMQSLFGAFAAFKPLKNVFEIIRWERANERASERTLVQAVQFSHLQLMACDIGPHTACCVNARSLLCLGMCVYVCVVGGSVGVALHIDQCHWPFLSVTHDFMAFIRILRSEFGCLQPFLES